jgi:hypothetical protein
MSQRAWQPPVLRQAEAEAVIEAIAEPATRALTEWVCGTFLLALAEGKLPAPEAPLDLAFLVRGLASAFADPVAIARVALGDEPNNPFPVEN